MAAAQSGKKKTQAEKRMKQALGAKTLHKKMQPKQKKVQLKQGKQETKRVAVRQGGKAKDPGCTLERPKRPQDIHQRKARLPTKGKGKGKAASFGKHTNGPLSSRDKGVKLGRNVCIFTSIDLQYEVNELIRKDLTARLFANNPHALH